MEYSLKLHLNDMRFMPLSIFASFLILSLPWILIILAQFPDPDRARHFYLMEKCTTNEMAEQLTNHDFKKGSYRLVLSVGRNADKSLVRDRILKEHYNIEVVHSGCITSLEVGCYSATMAQLLANKFGSGFYDQVLIDTENEYACVTSLKPSTQ